jgi:DNA polymerase-3 subunit gamma/tau
MSYVVLARKYRPQTFNDVYAQDHIVRIFKNAIENDRIGQAYLFTGSRGVGKTSVARILAKSLNCEVAKSINPCNKCSNCIDITQSISPDVVEIDGASNTGVDDIRELQKELFYSTSQSRYKIIIIDEVHMLSKNAFNALLKTLEEPPDKVLFIFATTEPHKVLPTIVSRCQRFDFKRIPVDAIVNRLKEISTLEKINVEEEALYVIARKADGGMRDALSLMDQVISYGMDLITVEQVQKIFGLIDTDVFNTFMQSIADHNPAVILQNYFQILDKGVDIHEFINNYLEYLRQFLFVKMNLIPADISKNMLKSIQTLCPKFNEDEIIYIMNYLIETKNNLRTSSSPEILAELTFVKLARISEMKSVKKILDTISSGTLTFTEIPKPIHNPEQLQAIQKHSNALQKKIINEQIQPEPEISELTIDILKDNWPKITNKLKEIYPVSVTFLETAEIEKVHNNHIYINLKSETGFKKLQAEKDVFEDFLSKHFRLRIMITFTFIPEEKQQYYKNPGLQDIKKESPNLAEFIEMTDSLIRQE